jgi:hypothetical protein
MRCFIPGVRDGLARRWLSSRARVLVVCGAAAAWGAAARGRAPGRSLEALAEDLSRAAGAHVDGGDVRWAPSGGAIADAVVGRWALFLARAQGEAGDDARDVWRARVRTTPEGDVIEVGDAFDLTNTPLGDDHQLVVLGDHAAFATRAYGQEQSIVALDLRGEGARNRAATFGDRAMAAITNWQQTGNGDGVGRVEVTLEAPAAAAGLVLGPSALDVQLFDARLRAHDQATPPGRAQAGGGASSPPAPVRDAQPSRALRIDLERDDLAAPVAGVRAEASMHLPKRFSHWTVDTLRAVPWIGPAPIAWLEDEALGLRDSYRRATFHATGDATDVVATADPPPPALDTSEASVEEAHWPPARITSIWKEPEPGEGEWTVPDVPWLRKTAGVAEGAPSAFYRTFLRPDEERPYAKVLLVAMDTRQLDFDMEAGVEDPEPLTGPHGSGRIPRDPAVSRRVAAAFNGAFKTEHGHYGMMVHKRVLLPPVAGAATVVVLDDGRVGFGTWGEGRRVGGLVGVDDDSIVSFRQNLEALIDRGQVNPTGRSLWGFTLPGKGAQTERTGLCVTTSGHLLYAWGDDVSATTLARAMKMGGCDYALHLDMNPYHTGFIFTAIDDLAARKYRSQLLAPSMSIPADRYIQYAPKDFFYVLARDVTPPAVDGAAPWESDGGTQPPPAWMPGVWKTRVDGAEGPVDLVDVEAQRAAWIVRAGASESPAASPLRELTGDDSKRVLLAVGAGVAPARRPLGIATAGRVAVPVRGGADSGVALVGADGRLSIVRGADAPAMDPARGELLELPLILWAGKPVGNPQAAEPSGAAQPRSALGMTAGGRVIVARGVVRDVATLGDVLARAGCVRALSLDRGERAAALLDRAGTADPPRGRYDESVLYAVARPLPPRGFRFDAASLVAEGSKSGGSKAR